MPAPLTGTQAQFFDNNGDPLAGGKLFFYIAGTATFQQTYTDSTVQIPNANPVILDASGRAAIWCPDTFVYKIICKNALDVVLWTIDNVHPAGAFPYPYPTEWTLEQHSVGFVAPNQFNVYLANVTNLYSGRMIRATNTGGVFVGQVTSTSFVSPNTLVTVEMFSGALDNGLSKVEYGAASAFGSLPPVNQNASHVAYEGTGGAMSNGGNAILGSAAFPGTMVTDFLSEFDAALGRFKPKVSGTYLVTANGSVTRAGVTFAAAGVMTLLAKNGGGILNGSAQHAAPLGTPDATAGGCLQLAVKMFPGDYLEVILNAEFSAGSPIPTWSFTIQRIA